MYCELRLIMKEAILPLFGFILLQPFVAIVGLNIIVREKKIAFMEALRSWVFGQLLLLGSFQLLAVPMILAKCKFYALYYSYAAVACVLFGFGCREIKHCQLRQKRNH